MAKIEITKTELIWPGKYGEDGTRKEVERVSLPFQVIETIKEARATREAAKKPKQKALFDIWESKEGDTFEEGWKNKLIWGDNLLVMCSLLEKFAGKIDLIYIDPPFATGADFSFTTEIGDGDLELTKKQSVIEEKAYRDTWGQGLDSYLQMLYERLLLMRDLLTEKGSIFVHLDVHNGPYIKSVLDEIFGRDNFQNQIAWYYYNKLHGATKRCLPKAYDIILYYLKNKETNYTYCTLTEPREKPVKKLKYRFINGKIENIKDESGKTITYESTERQIDNVWRIRCLQPANLEEWVNFNTQKPVDLIQRILQVASNKGDLILDVFCGSGSSLVASELLGRRWIGCDLSRWAIHVSRKRLLGVENCKPFEILNLGKYERKYWQGVTFGDKKKSDQQLAVYQYLAFILKLYGAEPISGMQHLHGKKGKAVVHVGAVDAPVTIDEINACLDECLAIQQKELHVLGWEWEMGLYDLMTDAAKGRGVKLVLLNIPREVMEQQAVDKGDIKFFELAYLEVDIKQEKGRKITISLKDFVIPNTELVPEEIRSKIKKWSDYIDYWAIDWDFQNDTFMNGWVTYRTRKDRTLALKSDAHSYEKPGKYTVMVKVVDIFGNDTSQAFDVEVK
jgi:DNA modification methylase